MRPWGKPEGRRHLDGLVDRGLLTHPEAVQLHVLSGLVDVLLFAWAAWLALALDSVPWAFVLGSFCCAATELTAPLVVLWGARIAERRLPPRDLRLVS